MKTLLQTQRTEIQETLKDAAAQVQIRAQRAAPPLSINLEERTIAFVLSDESQDHAGDIVRQAGWDLGIFNQNPVLPWCHNYEQPPVGNWQDVTIKGTQLQGVARFAKAEDYPFADTIFRLASQGFLKGVSVGFKPTSWNVRYNDQQRFMGYEFLTQQLLECSACTVPMNPNALAKALKENAISKKELAEVVTQRVMSELAEDISSHADLAALSKEFRLRLEKMETDLKDLKVILAHNPEANGHVAASDAVASAEAAKVLALIAEIKTLCHPA